MPWQSIGVRELILVICCPSSLLAVVLGIVIWLVTMNRSRK